MRYQFRRPPQRERYVRDLERAGPRGRRAMLIPCGHDLGRRRRCLARSRQLSRVVASDHRRAHGSADGNGRRGARARNAWLGDVMVGLSLWYLASTVEIVAHAKQDAGATTIVLTDSAVSSATQSADHVLVVSASTVGPRLSMTGFIALTEVIVARTALVDPRRSRAAAARASDLCLHGYILGDPRRDQVRRVAGRGPSVLRRRSAVPDDDGRDEPIKSDPTIYPRQCPRVSVLRSASANRRTEKLSKLTAAEASEIECRVGHYYQVAG